MDGDSIVEVSRSVVTSETALDLEVGVEARKTCNGDCSSGASRSVVTSERAVTIDVEDAGLCDDFSGASILIASN